MVNPGLIYFLGAAILYLMKGKGRGLLALLISLVALITIFRLPLDARWVLGFLDFELVLLEADNISKLVGLIFAIFGFSAILYSINIDQRKSYTFYLLYIGSSIAVVFVRDLISFYIFWELMTITSYFLIFDRSKPITKQTSYYYFIMHMVGAVSLLWGIMLQYYNSGSILMDNIEYGLPFFILAVGIKLAFIGLHTWLPQNYSNVPFTTSVLLSAFTTKVGVYGMYRLLGGVGLAYAGVFSSIVGVFFALKQTKIRKLLSYHIVSQIGYMIAGIGVGTYLGSVGGIFHLFNHILYKGLLFMVAGVLIYATGEEDLVNLGGLSKKLPWTTFYGTVASLAIAGVPFFNGYTSKLIIKSGSSNPILFWGLYIAGIGTSLSFMKVMYFGFFRRTKREVEIKNRPKNSMLIGMGLLAGLIIFIGLNPTSMERVFDFDLGMDYFALKYLWAGIQPTLWALVIFKLAHDIIEPHEHPEVNRDLYPFLGWGLEYLSGVMSKVHNGNLNRYLLWVIVTLLIYWTFIIY